jgi:hypothetical protein
VTLEAGLGLVPSGAAGIVVKPLSAGEYARAEREVDELVDAVASGEGMAVERSVDSFGFRWVVMRDEELEDLVTAVHVVASELERQGFGEQLLAATFAFRPADPGSGARPVQLIYGFKRGAFWPFVPTGEGQRRDNAYELRLKNELERELPIEQDLSRWLGLFDAPL